MAQREIMAREKSPKSEPVNEILTCAEKLTPLIRDLRDSTEQDRRIAAPIVQALRQSDLCRMLLDTGAEPKYTPEQWLSVLEILAGAEASVAWIVWNNTLPCFWARFLDAAGRERIFGDTSRLFAGSTRPTGQALVTPGGFQLTGRWSLVSGCELADYIYLMGVVHEDGGPRLTANGAPEIRALFVPKGRYTILDTWHVGGLRGSGSNDVVVEDLFVATEDSFMPTPPVASRSQLAQLPIITILQAGIGAQFLGMASTAITVALEILRSKVSVDPGTSIHGRSSVLASLAYYSAAVAAARSHLHASMAGLWQHASHALPTAEQRAIMYAASLHGVAVGRDAVAAMHAAAGTPALYTNCPLERSIRDIHTMEQHIDAQSLWLEDAGRVLLGHEPINPLFMI